MQRVGGTYQEMVGSRKIACPGNISASHIKFPKRHQVIHVFKWGWFNGVCLFPASVPILNRKVNQGRLRVHHGGQWLMKWTSLHAMAWWHPALSELIRELSCSFHQHDARFLLAVNECYWPISNPGRWSSLDTIFFLYWLVALSLSYSSKSMNSLCFGADPKTRKKKFVDKAC